MSKKQNITGSADVLQTPNGKSFHLMIRAINSHHVNSVHSKRVFMGTYILCC